MKNPTIRVYRQCVFGASYTCSPEEVISELEFLAPERISNQAIRSCGAWPAKQRDALPIMGNSTIGAAYK